MIWLQTLFENTPALNAFFWFIQATLDQVLNSTVNLLQYIFCFKWVTDIAAFPIVAPSLVSHLLHLPTLENIAFQFPLDSSEFSFVGPFFQGFLTAAVLSIPSSPARLLAVRNWVVQGVWLGSATLIGLLSIEFFFISSCVLGITPVLEFLRWIYPFWFVLGLICMLSQFSQLLYANGNPVERIGFKTSLDQRLLIQTLFQGILLATFEQTNWLPYLGNFVIGPDVFIGEGFNGLFLNTTYLFGIFLGLVIFGFGMNMFIGSILSMRLLKPGPYQFIFFNGRLAYFRGVKFSRLFGVILLVSVFLSLPYYSAVYLATQPVSLTPREAAVFSNEMGWLARATQLSPVSLFNSELLPVGLWNRSVPVDRSYRKLIRRNVHNWRGSGNYVDTGIGPGTKHFPSLANFSAEMLLDRTSYRSYLMNHINEVHLRNLSDRSNTRRFQSYLSPWFSNWNTKFVSIFRSQIGNIPIVFWDKNHKPARKRTIPFNSVLISRDSNVYGLPKVGKNPQGQDVSNRMGPSSFVNKAKIAQTRSQIQANYDKFGQRIIGFNQSNFQNRKFRKDVQTRSIILNPWHRIWVQLESVLFFPFRVVYGILYQFVATLMRIRVFSFLNRFSSTMEQNEPRPGKKLYFEGLFPNTQFTRGVRRWLVGRELRVRRAWQYLKLSSVQPRMFALYSSQYDKIGLLRRLFIYQTPKSIQADYLKKGLELPQAYDAHNKHNSLQSSKVSRVLNVTPTPSERRLAKNSNLPTDQKSVKLIRPLKKLFYQASGRNLGQDPIPELTQNWATAKWLTHQLEGLQVQSSNIKQSNKLLAVPTASKQVKIFNQTNENEAQLSLRRQIKSLQFLYTQRYKELHENWLNRYLVKSRSEPWHVTPSEEQLVWVLSRIHPQSVGSVSEASFNLSRSKNKIDGINKESLDDLNKKTMLRPRRQVKWFSGINRLTQGDRLIHAREIERDIKAISPTLLRYNRYLQINRNLFSIIQPKQTKLEDSIYRSGLVLNGLSLEPIQDKLLSNNSSLMSSRSIQPITGEFLLFGSKFKSPSIYQPFNIEYNSSSVRNITPNYYKNLLSPRIWTYNSVSKSLQRTMKPWSLDSLGLDLNLKTGINEDVQDFLGTKAIPISKRPDFLSVKSNSILQNIKRWATYQELLGEREFFYRRQGKRGKRRRTKDLRVLRFGNPNPYMFQTSADFTPQIVPGAYGRRRTRSPLIPVQESWQYTIPSQKSPTYNKSKKSFFTKKNKRRKRKQYKKLKKEPTDGFSSTFLDSASSTRQKKRRKYRKRSKLKRNRRFQALVGDRAGFINIMSRDFDREDQERKLKRRLSLFEEKGVFKVINDFKIYALLMLSSGINLKERNDWSSQPYRQVRAKMSNLRRADQDWERPSFANNYEQLGQQAPVFTRTTRSELKMDRRLMRPTVPMAYSHGDVQALNVWVGLMRATSTYIHGLPLVVDKILGGQPIEHNLTPDEELQLVKRRNQLARYYDSLRDYRKSQNWKRFAPGGSRTWVDNIYNHQFKGTLKTVRRLFYLTPLNSQNTNGSRVYKYNQLLYDREGENYNPSIHEELGNVDEFTLNSPFMEVTTTPAPFYIGWDTNSDRIILTNKSQSFDNSLKPLSNTSNLSLLSTINQNTRVLHRKVLEWTNQTKVTINNLNIQTYEPTRLARYRFFKKLEHLDLTNENANQNVKKLTVRSVPLLTILSQIRLRNKLAYGTLDLLGPWVNPVLTKNHETGESNRYLLRSTIKPNYIKKGVRQNQINQLKDWFNIYRPYHFGVSRLKDNGSKPKRYRRRSLYKLGSPYSISGPNTTTRNTPYFMFELGSNKISPNSIKKIVSSIRNGFSSYPEANRFVLPLFVLNQTRPMGSRSQWNSATKFPTRIIDFSNRQQSNRSVPFSLMWNELIGCRYLVKQKVLSLSTQTILLRDTQLLPDLVMFEDRALKDMVFWSKSSALKKRKNSGSPIKSNSLPPQGRGVQDKGTWRLRRTRSKAGKRKLAGFTYPSNRLQLFLLINFYNVRYFLYLTNTKGGLLL